MSHTKMKAGRLLAVYVDDGQGRRLVLAEPEDDNLVASRTLVFARTQAEAFDALATIRQLVEELPP